MAVQCAVAVIASILVFPQSVNSSFIGKLGGVIGPLDAAYSTMQKLFSEVNANGLAAHSGQGSHVSSIAPSGTEKENLHLGHWVERGVAIRDKIVASAAPLGPAKAQTPYLLREFSYGRLSGDDLKGLFKHVQTLQLRAGGLSFFFDVVEGNIKHNQLDTAVFSVHDIALESHVGTPATSRANSPTRQAESPQRQDASGIEPRGSVDHAEEDIVTMRSRPHGPKSPGLLASMHHPKWHMPHWGRSNSEQDDGHSSKVSLFEHVKRVIKPVGLYESARYMNLERTHRT